MYESVVYMSRRDKVFEVKVHAMCNPFLKRNLLKPLYSYGSGNLCGNGQVSSTIYSYKHVSFVFCLLFFVFCFFTCMLHAQM